MRKPASAMESLLKINNVKTYGKISKELILQIINAIKTLSTGWDEVFYMIMTNEDFILKKYIVYK